MMKLVLLVIYKMGPNVSNISTPFSINKLSFQHQNPQQLSANLWAAVRARGCQFLGPGEFKESYPSRITNFRMEGPN